MKIAIAGIDAEKIAQIAKEYAKNKLEIEVMSDIEGAMALQNNKVNYYLGSCMTGGGGALAMAIAILGAEKCITVASPTTILNKEEIAKKFKEGKKAFGFVSQAANKVVPIIIEQIVTQN